MYIYYLPKLSTQTSTVQSLKFWDGQVFSLNTLTLMWVFIHYRIENLSMLVRGAPACDNSLVIRMTYRSELTGQCETAACSTKNILSWHLWCFAFPSFRCPQTLGIQKNRSDECFLDAWWIINILTTPCSEKYSRVEGFVDCRWHYVFYIYRRVLTIRINDPNNMTEVNPNILMNDIYIN